MVLRGVCDMPSGIQRVSHVTSVAVPSSLRRECRPPGVGGGSEEPAQDCHNIQGFRITLIGVTGNEATLRSGGCWALRCTNGQGIQDVYYIS